MYKVLLVDDEYMVTEGLMINPWKMDMQVVATANHADDALDYVKKNPVDVIISDVNMLDKTDLRWLGKWKELLPDTDISLLSGYQEFEYKKPWTPVSGIICQASRQELGNLLWSDCAANLRERW